MKKILQFLEGLSFIIYLFALLYIILKKEYIVTAYNLPDFFIPTLSILGIVYLAYKYLSLNFKVNNLEYEFTSIVNHTFRTPLTRVMWLVKELERDMSQKERLLLLQGITNATDRVLEIVDLFAGVKNINDTSSYFFEAISVRDIVEKSIAKYREEVNKKDLKFEVSTFKDIPLLTLDIKKISFVVDALVENAILYTPKGGNVYIDTILKKNSFVLFVKDTGIGLTLVDKFRIFSRFYRSKRAVLKNPDGMGLKLYLSKQIMRRHKGTLYAISKGKEEGSTFFMELPFNK